MLRPAEGVHYGHRPVGYGRRGDHFRNIEELFLGCTADLLNHLRGVTAVVLLQQLIDAAWVL